MKYKYGVYGGRSFGGRSPMVNKYFTKKSVAKKYIRNYKYKFPRRTLKLAEF